MKVYSAGQRILSSSSEDGPFVVCYKTVSFEVNLLRRSLYH
jgi:hypothetical protein